MTDLALAAPIAPTKSATDQVFSALYEAVISLRLPPGTKVSEAEVAKQMDVSRQPVRDAFFRLSDLGFLSIRPQRATLITPISEQAVLDAVFTRTALEVECLRLAMARMGPDDVANLDAQMQAQKAALSGDDPRAFHALDERFHETLCQIAGQPQAWGLILDQKAHMDRIRYLTLSAKRQELVLAEHAALVKAIAAGQTAEAERHLRAHLADIGTILDDVRSNHPDYFA